MKIKKLKLKNYRNYEFLEIDFDEFSYNGKDLLSFDVKNSQIVMALGDYEGAENADIAITDLSLSENFRTTANHNVKTVVISSQRIYVWGDETVSQYTTEGVYVAQHAVKNNIKNIVDYNGCVAVYSDGIEKIEKVKAEKSS